MPFSEGTILQLHCMLYRYMPQPGGHWKATNNDIVERYPDGSSRIRFRPVAAHLPERATVDRKREHPAVPRTDHSCGECSHIRRMKCGK